MRNDQTGPAVGQFCDEHLSWLCQAGQGECQRPDDDDESLDPDQLIGPDDILPSIFTRPNVSQVRP